MTAAADKKQIIFHIPVPLKENPDSASSLRPVKMIEAFKELGYSVDVVSGDVKSRKKDIKNIQEKIKKGTTYDFCYSESSTIPTALTQKGRFLPRPFLDFNFFSFLRKRNIPIGLFYRDVRWMFPENDRSGGFLKRLAAKIFYKYDLFQYRRLIDVLFLPSEKMMKYVPLDLDDRKIIALPPGCDLKSSREKDITDKIIKVIYAGGIRPPFYDISSLFEIVKENEDIKLTLVCRKNEYDELKDYYKIETIDRISVKHISGKDLHTELINSDVFAIIWKPIEYLSFAMPYKMFEAISFDLPIITIKGTSTSDFVEKYGIGWVLEEGLDDFSIDNVRSEFKEKIKNIASIKEKHTWKSRALSVRSAMLNKGENSQ